MQAVAAVSQQRVASIFRGLMPHEVCCFLAVSLNGDSSCFSAKCLSQFQTLNYASCSSDSRQEWGGGFINLSRFSWYVTYVHQPSQEFAPLTDATVQNACNNVHMSPGHQYVAHSYVPVAHQTHTLSLSLSLSLLSGDSTFIFCSGFCY